ncbi:MAG TPA: metallophosphoesterase [Cyclobacteriaceae bacterium]|jgi:hypothetical protein|nr:metallophosphoesterase [Cyclobacteriaceae bacterium]
MRATAIAIIGSIFVGQGYSQRMISSLYFIGDAGKTTIANNGVPELLRRNFIKATPSSFVFLGDNIYPEGMPPVGNPGRAKAENIIHAQLEMVKEFRSPVYFIPGNHDWKKGSRRGLDYVRGEQRYVDSLRNPLVNYLPKEGCPGPSEVQLSGDVVLIIIDSQWFLQQAYDSTGNRNSCSCKRLEDVLIAVQELMKKNAGKRIILAAHHPIYSYGEHGGVFSWRAHVFPLTDINPRLYLPLPIVGSLYPLYRKWIGDPQDLANPLNQRYRVAIEQLLKKYPKTLFVSGHEHALEYVVKDGVSYMVSGSAVNSSYVKRKKYASYASSKNGFARIDVFEDTSLSISYFEVGKNDVAFRVHLPPLSEY